MKTAVIYYKNSENIGDDIQTYAANKLIKGADLFLDRENLHKPQNSEKIKLLCNGWFMTNPINWPPANNIEPLFLSIYVDHKHGCPELMLNKNLKPYYEKFSPIGCRDLSTTDKFKKLGVNAYFSACVTLTLPKYTGQRTNEILFVDPFVKIHDKNYQQKQTLSLIPKKYADNVHHITHHDFQLSKKSIHQRMDDAGSLLDRYARAKCIITSRIHCALPAVAMGTPVYFIKAGYDRQYSEDRLKGLLDFFEVLDAKDFPVNSNKAVSKIQRKLKLYQSSKTALNKINFELGSNTELMNKKQEQIQDYRLDIENRTNRFFGL